MNIEEIYKLWLLDEYRDHYELEGVTPDDIKRVSFSSTVGMGSPDIDDPNFSTFAGTEIWTVDVDLVDERFVCISRFDFNPVGSVMRYIREKGIEVEYPEPPPPTEEEKLQAYIERNM